MTADDTVEAPKADLETISSLAKRRGFVFPSAEIYGGFASTYDYGPLGVEMKRNIRDLWWRRDGAGARRRRRHRRGDHHEPAVWEASGHVAISPTRWSTAATASSASARTTSRTTRLPELRRREPVHRARATFNLMFKTFVGPVEDDAVGRLPAAGDGAGHVRQLRERLTSMRKQPAVRHRADRQVVPQRDHAGQLHLPHARVRADGDGVLLQPGAASSSGTRYWKQERAGLVPRARRAPGAPALRDHERGRALALLEGTSDIEYLLPVGLGRARGHRAPRRLRPQRARDGSAASASRTSTRSRTSTSCRTSSSRRSASTACMLMLLIDAYDEETGRARREARGAAPRTARSRRSRWRCCRCRATSSSCRRRGEVWDVLRPHFRTQYDDAQSIGRRYRRQDEIGTPLCVTVDFESLERQRGDDPRARLDGAAARAARRARRGAARTHR